MMRVIGGEAKGHRLTAPKTKGTRPALGQVREAIFNILFNVEGERVLDLFAGSGAIGIEALSRGAAHCTFVEWARPALISIQKNLEHCRFLDRATILPFRVDAAIKKMSKTKNVFDLIFVDPPYEAGLLVPTLTLLGRSPLIDPQARIVVEHHPKEPIGDIPGLGLTDERRYGQTRISFLQPQA